VKNDSIGHAESGKKSDFTQKPTPDDSATLKSTLLAQFDVTPKAIEPSKGHFLYIFC